MRRLPEVDPVLEEAADLALETDCAVVLPAFGIVLVSDVLVLEAAAHGDDTPPTPRLERADGRAVYAYRLPEEWVL